MFGKTSQKMLFEIKIVNGKEAKDLLQDKSFKLQWKELALQDDKVTVIQEPSFVTTWYQQYENTYQPVFVLGLDKRSSLVGLIPLACSVKENRLTHAGDNQAEYHGWLCNKAVDQSFPIKALSALKSNNNLKEWRWRWLPPGSDINWLFAEELKREKIYVRITKQDSPLLDLHDEAKIKRLHRNRSIRTKINRYKNKLQLEKITSYDRAKEVFGILADQCDFRQMAVHGVTPFTSDKNKKPFYVNRFRYPENNHFTVLWSEDIPIAFHFGACDSNTVYVGLSGYNPCEERNSPGSILYLKLIKLLKNEGYRYLDLTPGGDPYKEKYSNLHQKLYMPTFYFSGKRKQIADLKFFIRKTIKKGLNINPTNKNTWVKRIDTFRFIIKKVLSTSPVITFGKLISLICPRTIHTLYRLTIKDQFLQDEQPDSAIKINNYSDLLKYNESSYWKSKRDLLFKALKRFSRGAALYTIVQNETLTHFGWIISGNDKSFLKVTGLKSEPPVNSVVFYDTIANPNYINHDSFTNVIKNIIALSRLSNTEEVFIQVSGNMGVFNKAIELAGFEVYGRLRRFWFFWRDFQGREFRN
jgi:hypothetical protein